MHHCERLRVGEIVAAVGTKPFGFNSVQDFAFRLAMGYRSKADQAVCVSSLMTALSQFLAQRGTRDLWSLLKPVELTWKSAPSYASLYAIVT